MLEEKPTTRRVVHSIGVDYTPEHDLLMLTFRNADGGNVALAIAGSDGEALAAEIQRVLAQRQRTASDPLN